MSEEIYVINESEIWCENSGASVVALFLDDGTTICPECGTIYEEDGDHYPYKDRQ